jgi:hypothetical protein
VLHRGIFSAVERLDEADRIKNSLLISFGLGLILQNVAQLAFTADERSVNTAYASGSLQLFGLVFPYTRLLTLSIVRPGRRRLAPLAPNARADAQARSGRLGVCHPERSEGSATPGGRARDAEPSVVPPSG